MNYLPVVQVFVRIPSGSLLRGNQQPVDSGSPVIAFQLPSPSYQHLSEEQVRDLESILGSPVLHTPNPKFINVGPNWAIVQLSSAAAILALQPDMARLAAFNQQTNSTGVVVFGPHGENEAAAIEVRTFAPFHGVNEDPVCGSGNGAVAAFLRESKQIRKFGSTYISSQGAVVGRNGRIFIALDGDESIRVGGQCVTCIDGVIVQPR
ncbi:PhzF family phenazine biosynthesis protein [Acidovorax sp. Root402]|uniref:PhzF family phenazine biosynthesis protein n=1 Tax=Acidovorax sp. Root402 TaxID=1736527 RepID=UPI0009E904AE|nr:PhzF family phenazine biosynthesis isomerase [Acidovorax sp. Root402]